MGGKKTELFSDPNCIHQKQSILNPFFSIKEVKIDTCQRILKNSNSTIMMLPLYTIKILVPKTKKFLEFYVCGIGLRIQSYQHQIPENFRFFGNENFICYGGNIIEEKTETWLVF